MKTKDDSSGKPGRLSGRTAKLKSEEEKENTPGYPEYPDNEDIYNKYHEEKDLNPEDPAKMKDLSNFDEMNSETYLNDLSGNDLDVPGGELDDDQENIGSEDEENNYYSLGEDDYDDLEKDKDDE